MAARAARALGPGAAVAPRRAAAGAASGGGGGGGARARGAPAAGRRVAARAAPERSEEELSAMEDELRDGSSFVGFLLPRPVRVVALGAAAAGCAVGTAVDIAAALAPGGADAPTLDALPINAAGALAFGAAAAWDAAGAERRRGERALVREAQLRSGDRVRVQLGDGRATTKLLPVDAKWVSKRLESWGRSEGLPMLSPEKAAVLRGIVADAAPRAVVHVGSLLGYSTIQMCGALPDGGAGCRLVTLERDPLMFACAKRFVHQARLDGLASRLHEVPHAADVVLGNAVDRAAVARAAERAMAGAGTDGVDMLYLSGTPSEYGAYLAAASPFLRSGSVVVADHALVAERVMGGFLDELRDETRFATLDMVDCPLEWSQDRDAFAVAVVQ